MPRGPGHSAHPETARSLAKAAQQRQENALLVAYGERFRDLFASKFSASVAETERDTRETQSPKGWPGNDPRF